MVNTGINMVDIVVLSTFLKNHIRLGIDATGTATSNATIAEGVVSIEDLVDLYEDTGIR